MDEEKHLLELKEELNELRGEVAAQRVVNEAMRGKFRAMREEVVALNRKVEQFSKEADLREAVIQSLRELNNRYAAKYDAVVTQWQTDRCEAVRNAQDMTTVLAAARKHEYLLTRVCNVLVNDWLTDEQRKMLLEGKDYEEIRKLTLERRNARDQRSNGLSFDPQSRRQAQQTSGCVDLSESDE
jgi:hypothetical protein